MMVMEGKIYSKLSKKWFCEPLVITMKSCHGYWDDVCQSSIQWWQSHAFSNYKLLIRNRFHSPYLKSQRFADVAQVIIVSVYAQDIFILIHITFVIPPTPQKQRNCCLKFALQKEWTSCHSCWWIWCILFVFSKALFKTGLKLILTCLRCL